ncbi:MAG: hypothetical protein NZR01_10130 [Bryobacteraceae bacterium]|nr:hypothetical protein [Bryobacteraceae bacterium]
MSRLIVFLLLVAAAMQAPAGTVGRLVPMRGTISDVAVDDRRLLVYAANFTANRIEVFSSVDFSPRPPLVVSETPYWIEISRSGRFLAVGHFLGGLTIFDLDAKQRLDQTFPENVLALAFGEEEIAYVATNKGFYRLDPLTGVRTAIPLSFSPATCDIPVKAGLRGVDITMAAAGVSGDGRTLYFVASAVGSTPPECSLPTREPTYLLRYRPQEQDLYVEQILAEPPLGPRVVSVNEDGSRLMAGPALYWQDSREMYLRAQLPNVKGRLALGGHAYDWKRNRIYVQAPVMDNTATSAPPVLHVLDPDNLAVREILQLPNPVAGPMVFSRDMNRIYAPSQSGVLVLDMAELDNAPRVAASREDVLFLANACDRSTMRQTIRIEDPSGRGADFRIAPAAADAGVRVFPASGRAPMDVTVEVDPARYQSQTGTVSVLLNITSRDAVNVPWPVRVLINTKDFDQRGRIVNLPGRNVDIVADPARPRFYVLRQDRNEVVVVDSNTLEAVARLKTGNTPVQMAVTLDGQRLLTTADNSQYISVHNLSTLAEEQPILLPRYYFARSIAVSESAIWASSRNVAEAEQCTGGRSRLLLVSTRTARASVPARLGIFENCVDTGSLLAASPGGATAMLAAPNGVTMLYESDSRTWVAARQDFTAISGTAAAFSDALYVAGFDLLDMSLFPTARTGGRGTPAGAAAMGDGSFAATYVASPGPAYLDRLLVEGGAVGRRTVRLIESPLIPYTPPAPTNLVGATILPLLRTLTVMAWPRQLVSLSTSGVMVVEWTFDTPVPTPDISAVFNAADQRAALAPGSLMVIRGSGLASAAVGLARPPYPAALDEACVQLNGQALPLVRVAQNEILALIPYDAPPSGSLVVKSYGGASASYRLPMALAAPAIFRSGTAGPLTGLATIVRAENGELVTFSNPVQPEDVLSIYLTGMGAVTPAVEAGAPVPADPPARVMLQPQVLLGGTSLEVLFAGLEPGQAGVYRIDARVPWWIRSGNAVPLVIRQAGAETSVDVRVVPK